MCITSLNSHHNCMNQVWLSPIYRLKEVKWPICKIIVMNLPLKQNMWTLQIKADLSWHDFPSKLSACLGLVEHSTSNFLICLEPYFSRRGWPTSYRQTPDSFGSKSPPLPSKGPSSRVAMATTHHQLGRLWLQTSDLNPTDGSLVPFGFWAVHSVSNRLGFSV